MRERPIATVALVVWTAILIASAVTAIWTGIEVNRVTAAGFSDDGTDPTRRQAFLDLIVLSEAIRLVTPALVMASAVSLVLVVAVFAMRWQRCHALLLIVVLGILAGCTATGADSASSRAELYSSIAELDDDSDLVVVVTATDDASTVDEPQPATGVVVTVDRGIRPTGELPPELTVWQLGTSEVAGPLPAMRAGTSYLLFLVGTGLERGGYFITGSSAGFWVGDGDTFTRPVDEGDDLPDQLTVGELEAALAAS